MSHLRCRSLLCVAVALMVCAGDRHRADGAGEDGGAAPGPVPVPSADRANARSPLAINLAGVVDWSTEMPFVDVFRQSRRWISQAEGQPWGKGPELELTPEGWVRRTNDSEIRSWNDRPKPADATQAAKGVALEHMLALCNELQTHAWFCMPHLADDEYVRRFATQVRDDLSPTLKVYVEHSNEVWNGQFAQARYAKGASTSSGTAGPRTTRP